MNSFLISCLRRFDRVPFSLERHGKTFRIGEGEPAFRITARGDIPKKELLTSMMLALGEAYMRGGLTAVVHLFTALCAILSHVGRDNYPLYMKTAAFHVGHICFT